MSIVNRFGQFISDVGHSCYDMELYRRVRTRPLSVAVGYFAAFGLLASLLTLTLVLPSLGLALRDVRAYVSGHLPSGSLVQLRSGELSSNLSQPYNFGSDKTPFVLDTTITGLAFPESVKFDTGVLLGRDAMFFKRSASELRTYTYKGMQDFSLTREDASGWLDRYGAAAVAGLAAAFFVLYLLAMLVSTAFFIVLAAVVSLLIGLLWKVRLTYAQWLAVGFHAVTLPIILDAVFSAIGLNIPFVFTFVFYMFTVAVIADERSHPVAAGPVSDEAPVPLPTAVPTAGPAPAAEAKPKRPRRKPRTPVKRTPTEGSAAPENK